jgi:FHA domain
MDVRVTVHDVSVAQQEIEHHVVRSEMNMLLKSKTTTHRGMTTHVPVLVAGWDCEPKSHLISGAGEYSCGAASDDDVQIPLRGVDPRHCTLRFDDGTLFVRKTTGRIWVNDVPVQCEQRLLRGDVLAIGPAIFRVDTVSHVDESQESASTALTDSDPATSGMRRDPLPHAAIPEVPTPYPSDHVTDTQVDQKRTAAERRLEDHIRGIESQLQKQSSARKLDPGLPGITTSAETCESVPHPEELADLLRHRDAEIGELRRQTESSQHLIAELSRRLRHERGETETITSREAALDARGVSLEEMHRTLARREVEVTHDAEALAVSQQLHLADREELQIRITEADQREELQQERAAELAQLQNEQFRQCAADSENAAEQLAEATCEREAAARLRAENDDRDAALQQQRCEASERKSALLQLQQEIEDRKAAVAISETETDDRSHELENRCRELQLRLSDIRKFRRENAELLQKLPGIAKTAAESESLRSQIEDLREQTRESAETIDRLQASVCEYQQRYETLNTENELLQSTVDQHGDQRQMLLAKLESASAESDALRDGMATVQQTLQSAADELECVPELRMENEQLSESIREMTDRIDSLTEQLKESAVDRDEIASQAQLARTTITSMQEQLTELESSHLSEVDVRDIQIAELTAHREDAERETEMLQHEIAALNEQLAASQQERQQLAANAETTDGDADSHAEAMLNEIGTLRAELQSAAGGAVQHRVQFDRELLEKDRRIKDLAQLLDEAESAATEERERSAAAEQTRDQLREAAFDTQQAEEQLAALQQQHGELDAARDELVQQVETLKAQLQTAVEAQAADRQNTTPPTTADTRAAEGLTEELRDRDQLIRELKEQLIVVSAVTEEDNKSNPADAEQLRMLSQELDQRASVLDGRDEELKERFRRVERTEEELESQRRQLLDSRQQLEIARAEVQVAISESQIIPRDSTPVIGSATVVLGNSTNNVSKLPLAELSEPVEQDVEPPADSSANMANLKSELANLFGLKRNSAVSQSGEADPANAEFGNERVDLSQPLGSPIDGTAVHGVEMHFDDEEVLTSPSDTDVANSDTAEADAAAAAFMEKLLAESRQVAGEHLPEELSAAPEVPPAEDPPLNQPTMEEKPREDSSAMSATPGAPVSFIEQYMSGAFGNLGLDGETANDTEGPEAGHPANGHTEITSRDSGQDIAGRTTPPPRTKIDRDKLRQDMNSFRTLSAQSVEHALAVHAKRQEKLGANARIIVTVALAVLSILSVIAGTTGMISAGYSWTGLVAAIAMTSELFRLKFVSRARLRHAISQVRKTKDSPPAQTASSHVAADRHVTSAVKDRSDSETAPDSTPVTPPASNETTIDAPRSIDGNTQANDEQEQHDTHDCSSSIAVDCDSTPDVKNGASTIDQE